ncbi:MAG: hypothetical protein HZY76_22935 [Anaerolineae bacterium]|nr:MAG: hypothetical protein HZY76_22935 [Anaerolineae bacterium]
MNSRTFWGKVVTETTDPNGRDIPADPDPILYAHMLRIAHDIIKQHDRNDTVILGGLAGYYGDLTNCRSNYQKYLADLHDVGAWDAFDVAAIHPYHNSPDEQGFAPDEFIQRGLRYNLSTQACEATTASLSLLAEVEACSAHQPAGPQTALDHGSWLETELARTMGRYSRRLR